MTRWVLNIFNLLLMLHIFNFKTNKKDKIEKVKISRAETNTTNILDYKCLDFLLYNHALIYWEST